MLLSLRSSLCSASPEVIGLEEGRGGEVGGYLAGEGGGLGLLGAHYSTAVDEVLEKAGSTFKDDLGIGSHTVSTLLDVRILFRNTI